VPRGGVSGAGGRCRDIDPAARVGGGHRRGGGRRARAARGSRCDRQAAARGWRARPLGRGPPRGAPAATPAEGPRRGSRAVADPRSARRSRAAISPSLMTFRCCAPRPVAGRRTDRGLAADPVQRGPGGVPRPQPRSADHELAAGQPARGGTAAPDEPGRARRRPAAAANPQPIPAGVRTRQLTQTVNRLAILGSGSVRSGENRR
jgi:hypothetical protein